MIAGLLYLVVVATGMFNLGYVSSQIPLHGDPQTVLQHLLQSATLLRLGVVADLSCNAAFLILPLALYWLLGATNRKAALLMVALAVVQVPIAFVNATHRLDLLWLLGDAARSGTLGTDQIRLQVMLALHAYRNGLLVLEVFWGLWLAPLGYLVLRCGFLPRVLGVLLMLGCLGYLFDFVGTLLVPAYPSSALADYINLPAAMGEIGTCLWLLVMGARGSAGLIRPTAR